MDQESESDFPSLEEDLIETIAADQDALDVSASEELLLSQPTFLSPSRTRSDSQFNAENRIGSPMVPETPDAERAATMEITVKREPTTQEFAVADDSSAESPAISQLSDPYFPDMDIDASFDASIEAGMPVALSENAVLDVQIPDIVVEPVVEFPPSSWVTYVRDRVAQSTYPSQRYAYLRQRLLLDMAKEDHDYGTRLDASKATTAGLPMKWSRTLFYNNDKHASVAGGDSGFDDMDNENTDVDVVSEDESTMSVTFHPLPYDRQRAMIVMNEIEDYLLQLRPEVAENEPSIGKAIRLEEDPLQKAYSRRGTWTARQRSFFDACIKIIHQERHVRLACAGHPDEPIIRRLRLDRTADRFRRLMAGIQWNGRMVYWLHAVLLDGLHPSMLAIYLDVLQTLRPKIPELVNSLINYMLPTVPEGSAPDRLLQLLERPWDPVGRSVYHFDPSIKLPKKPLFVIAPHPYGKNQENLSHSRIRCISKFLAHIGTVVQVDGGSSDIYSPPDLYKNMLLSTKDTLVDLRKTHPNRSVVMVGLGIGSMVACQASLLEPCSVIICFGFPLKTPRGMHGEYGDPLLKLDAALQFFIGLDAPNCPHGDFLCFRDKLTCDTEVISVACCDDYLHMKSCAKLSLKVTQSIVDRCLLEEMLRFLQHALLKDPPRRLEVITPDMSKKRKLKPSVAPKTVPKRPRVGDYSPEIPFKTGKNMNQSLVGSSTSSSHDTAFATSSQSSMDTIPEDESNLVIPTKQEDFPPWTHLSPKHEPAVSGSAGESTAGIANVHSSPNLTSSFSYEQHGVNEEQSGRSIGEPRVSVIAHTNHRIEGAPLSPDKSSTTFVKTESGC